MAAAAELVAVKGFDFQVLDPPELAGVLRALSERLRRAADPGPGQALLCASSSRGGQAGSGPPWSPAGQSPTPPARCC